MICRLNRKEGLIWKNCFLCCWSALWPLPWAFPHSQPRAHPLRKKNPRHKLKWMQLHVQQISPLSPLRCPITQRWLIYVKVAVHTPGTTLIPPLASWRLAERWTAAATRTINLETPRLNCMRSTKAVPLTPILYRSSPNRHLWAIHSETWARTRTTISVLLIQLVGAAPSQTCGWAELWVSANKIYNRLGVS